MRALKLAIELEDKENLLICNQVQVHTNYIWNVSTLYDKSI